MRARDGLRGLVPGAHPLAAAPTAKPAIETIVPSASSATEVAEATPSLADTPALDVASPAQTALNSTPRLRESDLKLIQRTLQACSGNVSEAAARLGVSRGLVYRRLRAAAQLEMALNA
jgi:sigma-54 dependent transcriptional regulator, acetoin dehydrogenase operon transcriptional activator AcoR